MQNTALSFTERSGHCGATSSDHQSWHPFATCEGDTVVSDTVCREQESRSNITSVNVTLLMSFCWRHSVYVHCGCHFVDVTLLKSILPCCWHYQHWRCDRFWGFKSVVQRGRFKFFLFVISHHPRASEPQWLEWRSTINLSYSTDLTIFACYTLVLKDQWPPNTVAMDSLVKKIGWFIALN